MDDRRPRLEGLPLDVQLVIFDALAPYDLFRLGQSCRALERVMSQREVWIPALKTTCEKHLLFQPSFPVDSMTVQELRRSAMGPRRWYQKIARLTGMQVPLQPRRKRLIQEHEHDTAHAKLHVVPGGRYLLASTDYSITLWDLGSPHMDRMQPHALHCLQFKGRVTNVSNPIIYQEGRLRFTAQVDMIASRPFRLQVYEIGPLPESQHIRLLNELEIKRVGHNFYVEAVNFCDDSHIAFYFQSMSPKEKRIVIWNFAQDLLSSLHWHHRASSWVSKPSQLFVKDDAVTVLEPSCVTRWAIPPFRKLEAPFSFYEVLQLQLDAASQQIFSVGFFEAKFVGDPVTPLEHRTGIFSEAAYIQEASVVSHSNSVGLVFDVTWKTDLHETQSRVGLRRYRLGEPCQDGLPKLEILSSWVCSPKFHSQGFTSSSSVHPSPVSPDIISTQKAVYWWDYETQFDFAVLLAAMDEGTKKMEWQVLSLRQDVGPLKDTLISIHHSIPCLVSGRIAYLTRDNEHVYTDRFNEMHVLDF